MEGERNSGSIVDALRALGATVLGAVSTRVELAVVELREQGAYLQSILIHAIVGAVFLVMGLLLAALFVVVLFWDSYRLAAIGGVTLLYLGIAAVAFLKLRARAAEMPPPFEATLKELAADRDMFGGKRDEP